MTSIFEPPPDKPRAPSPAKDPRALSKGKTLVFVLEGDKRPCRKKERTPTL
jgi:hypothetical protein